MIRKLLLTLLLLSSLRAVSQPYSAYVNDIGLFFLLDGESLKQIDFYFPQSFKAGASLFAYLDNNQNFFVYQNGEKKKIAEGFINDYFVTRHLLVLSPNRMLFVYDRGNFKQLAPVCEKYIYGDSILAFYDQQRYIYNYYWDGEVKKMEEGIGFDPVVNMVAGGNVIAYNNTFNNFRVIYRGELIDLESTKAQQFKAAVNTVAYVDFTNNFKIFHKGSVYEVSPFPPKKFVVANDIVAFVDNTNQFKIFYDGEIFDIAFFTPTYLESRDNMLAFSDATNGLNIFYMGKQRRLENFTPSGIKLGPNSISYIDNLNRVQFVTKNKNVEVANDNIELVELDFDVLKVKIGFNAYKFYFDDKVIVTP
ncbi:MAG: hypothetical protein KJS45_08125 [Bacteroidetes bacterium]|nr:hypothetical protein [Bacteroidota bacterium]